jgi:hypothetical protein
MQQRLARLHRLRRRALRADPAVLTPAAGLQTRSLRSLKQAGPQTPLALRSSGDDSEGSATTPNAGARSDVSG